MTSVPKGHRTVARHFNAGLDVQQLFKSCKDAGENYGILQSLISSLYYLCKKSQNFKRLTSPLSFINNKIFPSRKDLFPASLQDLILFFLLPGVKTPGYLPASLRDWFSDKKKTQYSIAIIPHAGRFCSTNDTPLARGIRSFHRKGSRKNKLVKNLQDYNIISRHEVSFILNQYEGDFITKR